MEGYLLDEDDLFYSLPEEDVDDVAEFDVLLEDCDEDFEEERQTISPAPSTSKAKGKGRKKSGKQSAPSAPRLPCPHCTKTYANERTLKTHLNSVALQGLFQ